MKQNRLFKEDRKKCTIGDIVSLKMPQNFDSTARNDSPDCYVIICELENMHYGVVPAWVTKRSHSLLIWAKPSNIYIKADLYFEIDSEAFVVDTVFCLINVEDAVLRITTKKKEIESKRRQRYHNKQKREEKQIARLAHKLDMHVNHDILYMTNLKACQGGRVSPR